MVIWNPYRSQQTEFLEEIKSPSCSSLDIQAPEWHLGQRKYAVNTCKEAMSRFLHLWNENSTYLAELLWALNEQETVKCLSGALPGARSRSVAAVLERERKHGQHVHHEPGQLSHWLKAGLSSLNPCWHTSVSTLLCDIYLVGGPGVLQGFSCWFTRLLVSGSLTLSTPQSHVWNEDTCPY